MKKTAFTLVEVLVVLAIIALLAGIITPVTLRVKREAKHVTTVSNLRQCAQALVIYEGENGDLPVGGAADIALATSPTCDPFDSWRRDCKEVVGHPVIGSYGYARLVDGLESRSDWEGYLATTEEPFLLVSIHESKYPVTRFSGQEPDFNKCRLDLTCIYPDRLVYVRPDTGARSQAKTTFRETSSGTSGILFTWRSIFVFP